MVVGLGEPGGGGETNHDLISREGKVFDMLHPVHWMYWIVVACCILSIGCIELCIELFGIRFD